MSKIQSLNISKEQAEELPMVDLAFLILKEANTPFYYRDLMDEIARIKDISEEDLLDVIAQVYTEINIDGRFACVGNNLWGLKRWYPLDKAEDALGNAQRPRIINDEDDDLEEDELFEDEEEETDLFDKPKKRKKKSKSNYDIDELDDDDEEDDDDLDDVLDDDLEDDDTELDDDAELDDEFDDELDDEEIEDEELIEEEDN